MGLWTRADVAGLKMELVCAAEIVVVGSKDGFGCPLDCLQLEPAAVARLLASRSVDGAVALFPSLLPAYFPVSSCRIAAASHGSSFSVAFLLCLCSQLPARTCSGGE